MSGIWNIVRRMFGVLELLTGNDHASGGRAPAEQSEAWGVG